MFNNKQAEEQAIQHYGCAPEEGDDINVVDNTEICRHIYGVSAMYCEVRFEAKIYYDPAYDKFLIVRRRIKTPDEF